MQGNKESLEEFKDRIESCLSTIGDAQAKLEDAVVQTAQILKSLCSLGPREDGLSAPIWGQVDYLSLGLSKSSPALARMVLGGALGFLHPDRPLLKESDVILHLNAAYGLLIEPEQHSPAVSTEQRKACLFLLSQAYSFVCDHAQAIQTALKFTELLGGGDAIEVHLWIADQCIKGREGDHKVAEAARTALRIAADQQIQGTTLKGYQVTASAFLPPEEAVKLLEQALAWKEGIQRGEGEISKESPEMWKGVSRLLDIYGELNRLREAGELVQWFDPVAENVRGNTENAAWVEWQKTKVNLFVAIGDYPKAAKIYESLVSGKEDGSIAKTLCHWGTNCLFQGDTDDAIDYFNRCEDEHSPRLATADSAPLLSTIVDMYNRRGVCRYQLGEIEPALKDLEKGVAIKTTFVAAKRWSLSEKQEMAINYLYQARCHIQRGPNYNPEKAQAQLNVALSLVPEDSGIRAQLGYTELLLLWYTNDLEKAAAKGREYFLICAATQCSMGRNMKAGWVSFLDGTDMKGILTMNEKVTFHDQNQPSWAPLLWLERSHMRLFMFEKLEINSDHFDQCDTYALDIVNQAAIRCGPNTAIIAYSSYYSSDSGFFAYIITNRVNEDGHPNVVYMSKMVGPLEELTASNYNSKQKISKMKEVDALVTTVRRIITNRPSSSNPNSDPKPGLALLYKILVQSVQEYLPPCIDTLLFSAQGSLSQLPFAALYDEGDDKFLIEKMCVGMIPGLRALHRCFHQQALFQQEYCTNMTLCKPFVAGNPEPMGCGESPLPHAAEEAKEVA